MELQLKLEYGLSKKQSQESFFQIKIMKILFFISNTQMIMSFFPKIYKLSIGIGDCTLVYNSQSICFLKLEIPKNSESWVLPKVNEYIKYSVESKNNKLLFLNHYHSNSENGNSENKIIRIEIIYSGL